MNARKKLERVVKIDWLRDKKTVVGDVAAAALVHLDVIGALSEIRRGTRPGMSEMPPRVAVMFRSAAANLLFFISPEADAE